MRLEFATETKPATELAPAEVASVSVAYCYTDTGIRFYEPIEVNGVVYEGLVYQNDSLVSEDGKLVIVKGKLVIEDLIGSYTFTAVDATSSSGSKVSGKMVLELSDNPEKGNLMFTTMFDTKCQANVYAVFDAEKGTLSVASPQLYAASTQYIYGFVHLTAQGKPSTEPVVFTANVGEFGGFNGLIGDCAFNPTNGAYLGYFSVFANLTAKRD
jgi:hypothetical protein